MRLEIRNQKYSQTMRMKAVERVTDKFLKTLRRQRLPGNIQTNLNISETSDLTNLSEITDRTKQMREPYGVSALFAFGIA